MATPPRRFQLLDAMILVAATAAGCAGMQWIDRLTAGEISWPTLYREWMSYENGRTSFALVNSPAGLGLYLEVLIQPLFIAWTLALIPVRMFSPRPRLRHLACQPGMMAACASGLTTVFLGALIVAAIQKSGMTEMIMVLAPVLVGLSISASWMTLLLGRRWRAEASWIDRLGRALGVLWILISILIVGLLALKS